MARRHPARLLALLLPLALVAARVGPDESGASLVDSQEGGGPPHAVLDLSGGVPLDLADDGGASVALPFAFSWYEQPWEEVTVSNNGALFFAAGPETPLEDCAGAGGDWDGIAAFGDDLGAGDVRYATFGRYPHRAFAVEWANPHATVGGAGQIQAWLLEGGDGGRQEAVIVLADTTFGDSAVDGGAGAVIGAQPAEDGGLAWACGAALPSGVSAWLGPEGVRPAAAEKLTSDLLDPWYGSIVQGYAGRALAAGDVNGDGLAEVVIGQQDEDAAWLIYGGSDLAGEDLSYSDVIFWSESAKAVDLGAAALVADLDGDGLAEVLIGAPRDDTSAGDAGSIFGVAGGSLPADIALPSDADLWLAGPALLGDARAGAALAAADTDGDGYDDLLVGAPYSDTTATATGAVFLRRGGLGAVAVGALDDAQAVFSGIGKTDWAGSAVAAADLDGDGAAEIGVGAPNADAAAADAGRVYLLPGGSHGGILDLETEAAAIFDGVKASDKAGSAIAMGDWEGDGTGDLLFAAPYSNDGASDGGSVYGFRDAMALYGGLSGAVSASLADLHITGSVSAANAGAALALSDLDGDGAGDVLIGAPGEGAYVSGGGSVSVFTGGDGGELALEDAEHRIYGTASSGRAGTALAAPGDSDGDGHPDVILSAPYAEYGLSGAGEIRRWSYASDFDDADEDGFVDAAAGGLDCDDGDAGAWPSNAETAGNAVDDDCDGWIDDRIWLRSQEAHLAWDIDAYLGGVDLDPFDFETAASGELLGTFYAEEGLTLTADGGVVAAADVWGALPAGALGAEIAPGDETNSLVLTFSVPIDALSVRILDADGPMEVATALAGDALVEGVPFSARGPDRTGGAFAGFLFDPAVDEVILTAPLDDRWGIDDVGILWSDRTDRDGDGYPDIDGDCDDEEPAVHPGAAEALGNGIDDDCDGTVDGGDLGAYLDYDDWYADADILPEKIDFETLAAGDLVAEQYLELGVAFGGELFAGADIYGAAPVGLLAGDVGGSTLKIYYKELQPAVGLRLLDAAGEVSIQGLVRGETLYDYSVSVANDDVAGGTFVGLVFDYGVDELVITSEFGGDTWGVDDLTASRLGLDDADGDGLTEAQGDCDDEDAAAAPGAEETWYDGVDGDCDGGSDYDEDGDGYDSSGYGGADCDDGAGDVSPGSEETWYDGIDADCDGWSDYDADGDGHDYDPFDPGFGDDCDDSDEDVSPDAAEIWYDGVDSDCGGDTDYDADGDGYSAGTGGTGGAIVVEDCDDVTPGVYPGAEDTWYDGVDSDCGEDSDYDADQDGYDAEIYGGEDCDDARDYVFPGAGGDTWYDGVDTDCDGESDFDRDGDGYDIDTQGGEDCDDKDAGVHPGVYDAPGDGIDEDCDGAPEFDDDGDGYDGAEDGGDDCDDADPAISPAAEETWYDGIDQDCGGESDYDADKDDHDSDGWGGDDCDDEDATINPGATDYYYDGIDNDCDGDEEFDADGDGYPAAAYGGDDCDDEAVAINPGAIEIDYDGVDQDCDYRSDYDADRDGEDAEDYGGLDCDDADVDIGPYVTDVPYDGIDQDCSGEDDRDADDDGSELGADCDEGDDDIYPYAPDDCYDGIDADCAGDDDYDCDRDAYVSADYGGSDCDDAAVAVHPGAAEVWYDGIDQDCGGESDYDADSDGFDGEDYGGSDCDDAAAATYPGASDAWYDGLDADCGGESDYDADGDGHDSQDYGGLDCDDADPAVFPGAEPDAWYDGIDTNCDGASDYDADGDGYDSQDYGGLDCDDADSATSPGAPELADKLDNDCDGATEADDSDEDGLTDEEEQELGTDPEEADSDGDGLSDEEEVREVGTDPLDEDSDDDEVEDAEEVEAGTDPLNEDSDEDGLSDGEEEAAGTDPLDPDTDDDGVPDGSEEPGGDTGDTGGGETGAPPDDTGDSGQIPGADSDDPNADWEPPPARKVAPDGCGCASLNNRPSLSILALLLGLAARRRRG